LYLLARPPRPRHTLLTAHLRQWLQARQRLQRRPLRFRRLRFLLLALAFVAAVLAHAGSRFGGRPGAEELVVLVDTSASLAARSVAGTSAWQELRRRLGEQLAAVPEHIPVRMGLCGAELALHRGARAELLAALPATPRGRLLVDMAVLAAQLEARDQDHKLAVWSLTDGLGSGSKVTRGAVTLVGGPADNVGIVAVVVTDAWPLPDVRVAVTVKNLGRQPAACELGVAGAVAAVPARPLQLLPGQEQLVELLLKRREGGELRVVLQGHRDALATDDRITIQIPAPPAPEIAFYPADNPVLRAAAKALAAESGGRVVDSDKATRAGFLLVDGGKMPTLRPGVRAITFGTWLMAAAAADGTTVEAPVILDWDRQDPITNGLDLSGLRIQRCLRHGFGLPGRSLLRGAQQDLIVVAETAETASVHAAFRLADSNFALLAAFPQFLRRCYVRAYGQKAQARVAADSLLDAAESDLASGERPAARPLPGFHMPATPLAVPLLLLALLLLVFRVYV
ncbi:MAG: hypothetical protein ACYST0_12115, partial [Planctomycetota bacterium]